MENRIRGIVRVAVAAALACGAFVVAPVAHAACEKPVEQAVRGTPVGGDVCPDEQPSPRPTPPPSRAPEPKEPSKRPAPRARNSTAPAPSERTDTAIGPLPGSGITDPAPSDELGYDYPPDSMMRPYGSLDDVTPSSFFQGTAPGIPVNAAASGNGYWIRVGMLLAVAGTGTLWLVRARVRGAMIGLAD